VPTLTYTIPPNKKLVYIYDNLTLSAVTVGNGVPLGSGTVSGFTQQAGNTTQADARRREKRRICGVSEACLDFAACWSYYSGGRVYRIRMLPFATAAGDRLTPINLYTLF
jgi:hypothetical protein